MFHLVNNWVCRCFKGADASPQNVLTDIVLIKDISNAAIISPIFMDFFCKRSLPLKHFGISMLGVSNIQARIEAEVLV